MNVPQADVVKITKTICDFFALQQQQQKQHDGPDQHENLSKNSFELKAKVLIEASLQKIVDRDKKKHQELSDLIKLYEADEIVQKKRNHNTALMVQTLEKEIEALEKKNRANLALQYQRKENIQSYPASSGAILSNFTVSDLDQERMLRKSAEGQQQTVELTELKELVEFYRIQELAQEKRTRNSNLFNISLEKEIETMKEQNDQNTELQEEQKKKYEKKTQ